MVAMERSNGGRVGEAFDLLATGLSPFVDRQMRAALGDSWMQSFHRPGHSEAREHSLRDPAFLLRAMDETWDTAFRSRLTRDVATASSTPRRAAVPQPARSPW